MKSINVSNPWKFLALSILLVAIFTRFSASTMDKFGYDDYALMYHIDKSFHDYREIHQANSFAFPLIVHYWLSNRILGDSMIGYRILPLISSIAMLLFTYFSVLKLWPQRFDICFYTILVLAFSKISLFFTGYSMFTYSNSLLVSCMLFFIFLKLAKENLSKKQWLVITIIMIPMSFFTHPIIVIVVATGVISVIVFRLWQFPESRNIRAIWKVIWNMKPMLIFPLMQLAVFVLAPLDLESLRHRYYLTPFLFPESHYSKNVPGLLYFTFYNLSNLFATLLLPFDISKSMIAASTSIMIFALLIMTIMAVIIIASIVIQLVKKRLDSNILFILIFIFINLFATWVGGFLGLYPFGFSRYTYWLLVPIAVLIGYGSPLIFNSILSRFKAEKAPKAILMILALIILLCGIYFNLRIYLYNMEMMKQNTSILQAIKNSGNDCLVLFSYSFEPVLHAKAPDQFKNGYSMGDGESKDQHLSTNEKDIPQKVSDTIKGTSKKILVVVSNENVFINSYPSWEKLITTYFKQVNSIGTPSIWVGYYERKPI